MLNNCSLSGLITEALMSMVDLADCLLSAESMPVEDLISLSDLKDCLISMDDFA